MAFIKFGNIDAKLIPMIYGCIFCFFNRLLSHSKESLLWKNPILHNITISSCKLFTIIPFIIVERRSSRVYSFNIEKSIEKSFHASSLENKFKNDTKKITKGKWRFIVLSAIIFLFNQFFYVISVKAKSNTTILNIILISIFYYFIFKIKLFKHHYLSVIMIVLVGFILDLVLGNLQYDIINQSLLLLYRVFRETLYSLSCVIDKYIMEKKFGSVYEIIFPNGVISFLFFIIFALFDYYYSIYGMDDYEKYFNNFDAIEFLVALGVIVTQLGLNLGILFTNKNYTPCHVFIIFIFGQLANYIDFSGLSIAIIFGLLFIIFLSLIFDEIIEINICGLSENTKRNISLRAKIEEDIIRTTDTIDSMQEDTDGYIIKSKDFKSNNLDDEDIKDF